MPQSGVYATPHKGLINNRNNKHATVGRRGDITERALKEIPQSGVLATPHKGLEKKVKYNNATVGRLSDIVERAFIHK